jgi:hypothetical protein
MQASNVLFLGVPHMCLAFNSFVPTPSLFIQIPMYIAEILDQNLGQGEVQIFCYLFWIVASIVLTGGCVKVCAYY